MKTARIMLPLTCWVAAVLVIVSAVIGTQLWDTTGAEAGPRNISILDQDLPVLGTVPAFQFRDQDNKLVTHATFRGSPWVADFIFTQCAGQCPLMTARMAAFQKSLPQQVKLVSFSLDPEHDTPAVLKHYARTFSADESRWKFLTGDQDALVAQARGMLLAAIPATAGQPIIHDARFVLIDGQARIRGVYNSMDPDALVNLERDADKLVVEDQQDLRSADIH